MQSRRVHYEIHYVSSFKGSSDPTSQFSRLLTTRKQLVVATTAHFCESLWFWRSDWLRCVIIRFYNTTVIWFPSCGIQVDVAFRFTNPEWMSNEWLMSRVSQDVTILIQQSNDVIMLWSKTKYRLRTVWVRIRSSLQWTCVTSTSLHAVWFLRLWKYLSNEMVLISIPKAWKTNKDFFFLKKLQRLDFFFSLLR